MAKKKLMKKKTQNKIFLNIQRNMKIILFQTKKKERGCLISFV